MPKCIDCQKDSKHGLWTITEEGWWLCNECWLDSYNNDSPEMGCAGNDCNNCDGNWECLNYHIIEALEQKEQSGKELNYDTNNY